MNNKDFLDALQVLAFDTSSSAAGLLFTKKDYKNIPFNERLLLQKARYLKASAVYFRRFEGKNNSIPQIFIYDNSSNRLDENDLADIHKKIWSGGIVPLYYVFDKTQLKVFDSRKPVQYSRNKIFVKPIDEISIVSKAHQEYIKYSAEFFRNGTFWEQDENRKHFLANYSANNKLIEGLRKIRESFKTDGKLQSITNKLLVLSILVKYLEERKDEQGNHVFPQGHLLRHYGVDSFCEVIRKGKLIKLFNDLSRHFNGKIFELTKQEKQDAGKLDLKMLADFLDANIEKQQYVLWRLYAFDYLPVELISRIYEEFIPQRRDVVYTPIHLVNFMVDECMPIEEPKTDFKVIDVSCGSGIFLVSVFKRLVQWWQKQGFDKKGIVPTPDIDTLKSILKDSVYGVDIEPEAVQLSIFSLSIALCDMLDPVQIWEELQFEDLSENNIIEDNFFNYLRTAPNDNFDLVIGNPPFNEYGTDEFNELLSDYKVEIT
ncbi:MAG: Eco57I restriction-modification methylase domain-containing protein, partial [Candidatus Scalindua sp.]